jgi:hypothetical protein
MPANQTGEITREEYESRKAERIKREEAQERREYERLREKFG